MDPVLWAMSALLFSALSLIGSLIVIYQIYRSQDTLTTSHEALVNAIFWMVFMDVFVSLWMMILYVPQFWGDVVYKADTWRVGFCAFLGFVVQFALSASCAWYFMIALMTAFLLQGTSTESIRRSIVWQHLFVWGVSGSGALVLLCFNSLGIDISMANAPPVECWLSKNQPLNSLWMYIPIFIYMVFSIFLLVYAAYKVRTFRDSQSVPKVSRRMVAFVLTFLSLWMIPMVDRIRYIADGESPPPPVAFIHWSVIALTGFANSVIWVSTKSMAASRHPVPAESDTSYNITSDHPEDDSFEQLQWTLLNKGVLSPPELVDNNNLQRDPSINPIQTGFTPRDQRQLPPKKYEMNGNHPKKKKTWHQKMQEFHKSKKPKPTNTEFRTNQQTYATTNSLIVVEEIDNIITVN